MYPYYTTNQRKEVSKVSVSHHMATQRIEVSKVLHRMTNLDHWYQILRSHDLKLKWKILLSNIKMKKHVNSKTILPEFWYSSHSMVYQDNVWDVLFRIYDSKLQRKDSPPPPPPLIYCLVKIIFCQTEEI